MWFDWQIKPTIVFDDLSKICPVGEYRVVAPEVIPTGIISPAPLLPVGVLHQRETKDNICALKELKRLKDINDYLADKLLDLIYKP